MKAFKLAALFIGACMLLSSCDNPWTMPIGLDLSLNFQDAAGKDLVEGIGFIAEDSLYYPSSGRVKPELYRLYIKNESVSSSRYPWELYYGEHPAFTFAPFSSLSFRLGGEESKTMWTIFLTCPYIFGDDAEHEITVYCKRKKADYSCYRLTFDGKEVEDIINSSELSAARATIVLD